MLAKLGKLLADPDRTILGTGKNALVLTRRHVDMTGQPVSAAQNDRNGAGAPPLNPVEKSSRNELSTAEKQVLRELKDRDRDVRQHEQKHMAAAGDLAKGGPRYHYQIGPDGKPYAVGGEVQIDTSPVSGDPEANRHKAERIRRAALAPGDASGPDLAVAADAHSATEMNSASDVSGVQRFGTRAHNEYLRNATDDTADHELRLFA